MRFLGLYLAWIVAFLGSLGSIFFHYLGNVEPSILIWYQRVCLDPLVIILGIASLRQFYQIAYYVMPQVCIGAVLALVQFFFVPLAKLKPFELCFGQEQCIQISMIPSVVPVLSFIAFAVIALLLVWSVKRTKYNRR